MVVREPTQRNVTGMGYDNGDDVERSKREALVEPRRWARVEVHRTDALGVDRNNGVANIKNMDETLQLVEKSLNESRVQP